MLAGLRPSAAWGADPPAASDPPAEASFRVHIVSDTLFRAFQRDTQEQKDARVLPLYEYLQVDLAGMDDKGFSLHMYGWGRADLNDSRFYHDNPDGELLYGYLQYRPPNYGLNLKLGRQHVFKGVINSSIDGLALESPVTPYFNIALYGGLPVASSDDGYSGDSFWGGRISHHLGTRYEIGLSYKLEDSGGETGEELLGIDYLAALPGGASVSGLSAYNLSKHGWAQHLFEAGFNLSAFHFRPYYQRYSYDEFFNTRDNSAAPFRFLADSNEILTVIGSDVRWQGIGALDLGAKVIHYSYDQRDDDAMYYEGNAAWYLSSLTQVGGQVGRMEGGTPETAYFLARLFFYWDKPLAGAPLGFLTGDVMYVLYDEEIFGKDRSLFLSLGGGFKFWKNRLELKLSGDYGDDPYFDSDLRGLLQIKYNVGK